MGKGAKGKLHNVRDADVAKFPGVDGTLMPNATEQSASTYVDRIRLEGKVPKQVDAFYRMYMPKKQTMAPIPPKHPWEATTLIQVVENKYRGVSDHPEPTQPNYKKGPEGATFPMPKGTPYFIKYLKPIEPGSEDRFGVIGNTDLDKKDRYNLDKTMRTYLVTRMARFWGASRLKDTASKLGIKTTPVRGEDGILRQVKVTCDECGGYFRRDGRGDYVCQDCGLIYQKIDVFSQEEEFEDEEGVELNYVDDEEILDAPEAGSQTYADELGGKADAYVAAIEARYAKHQLDWKAKLEQQPSDEEAAAKRAKADMERHQRAMKAFAKMNGHTVYEGKWSDMKTSARKAKMLFYIKHHDVTKNELMDIMQLGSVGEFYKLINALVDSGRIAEVKEKGVRTIKLVYLGQKGVKPARAPKEFFPTKKHFLLQVYYGGSQRWISEHR